MTVKFILNGADVETSTEANVRLIDLLRETFGLRETKCGCMGGFCGGCTVLFNGKIALSCLIPAFRVRGGEVVTIEGFREQDEFRDIEAGFAQAGVRLCDFCAGAKILVAEALLERKKLPPRPELLAAFDGVTCRCTAPQALADGVAAARSIRERRRYDR